MAAKPTGNIPDYKEKQALLYIRKTPPETLLEIAAKLIETGRFSEAYDYIQRSGEEKKLEEFMYMALDRGDFFNFDRAALRLDLEIPPELWERLGDNAAGNERYLYAVEAYRRAGRRHKADEIIRNNEDLFGPVLEMDRRKAAAIGKLDIPEETDVRDMDDGKGEDTEKKAGNAAPEDSGSQKSKKKKRKK